MLTVYTARRIHTMNDPMPIATAVAVRDGRIVEVGDLHTLLPWLKAHEHRIDDRFADKILMPGFIDPHLHPSMAAILLPMHFITAMEWRLPWDRVAPVASPDAFDDRLRELDRDAPAGDPLLTWGFHEIWHGPMNRQRIDAISATRPIIVWQRSFHEIHVNSAALEWMGVSVNEVGNHPHVDLPAGRFFEMGLSIAFRYLNPYLLDPNRFRHGLDRVRQVVHSGGHTTIGDMAAGLFDLDLEWDHLVAALDRDDVPFRVEMVPRAVKRGLDAVDLESGFAENQMLPERNTRRLRFSDHVKLFTDGGFFAELMQLQEPGFIDGHHGEWLTPPETFEQAARLYWNAGYRIHVHCTGDLGVELALDVLEKLQFERPRFDHRFTIEHFGISTPEQVQRMASLGALASVNAYYVYELSEAYYQHSVGFERASQMARLGSLARAGVTAALHTDFTMAPALPLNSAWVAVNRLSEAGTIMCPEERISVHQAMRAITIDAAYVLGREAEIGSIRAGKMADFTVLEKDPYEVAPEALRDVPIWGTVFEGIPFPVDP